MSITQISVFVESRPGHLTRTLEAFAEAGIQVRGFCAGDTGEYGIVRFIVDRPDAAMALLAERGAAARTSEVLCARLDDRPGALARAMVACAQAGINIVYCYSLAATCIALSVKDIASAEAALADADIDLVDQAELARVLAGATL
ncbi:amino acid-binding protein [Adlercreutzia faecimuris]|uniref:Amino acid-binding protein n=1 Tax=Adlercreutzia faecimuris TaxID=2897341 RepID=A0ABS9WGC1_9ACTN|nr:amino acid-binding protein [Adlercreutzia sp. JBNU-10]MCI2241915.1 amino acid-binding protein [Adlercreutzia sp. JBNU-10]